MKLSVGEGVEGLDDDDEGVNNEGVDNSLSPPLSKLKFALSPFNGNIDLELLSIGEKELNLKGGENAALDTFWMLRGGVSRDVRLKAAGVGRGLLTRVRSKYPRR
jgi:hypothetical protein